MDSSSARGQIAHALQTEHPTWVVKAFPFTPENVARGKPVISVFRPTLSRNTLANVLDHALTITIFAASVDNNKAEDELDDTLDALLLTLQGVPGFTWSTCERQNFKNEIAGIQISATIRSRDIYRAQHAQKEQEQ